MKLFRLSTIAAIALAVLSGVALFHTAQRVQESESDLRSLKQAVAQEEQTIRVLRAEWDYLNRPDRLEALAREKLDLVPPSPESVGEKPVPAPRQSIEATPAVLEPAAGKEDQP